MHSNSPRLFFWYAFKILLSNLRSIILVNAKIEWLDSRMCKVTPEFYKKLTTELKKVIEV